MALFASAGATRPHHSERDARATCPRVAYVPIVRYKVYSPPAVITR